LHNTLGWVRKSGCVPLWPDFYRMLLDALGEQQINNLYMFKNEEKNKNRKGVLMEENGDVVEITVMGDNNKKRRKKIRQDIRQYVRDVIMRCCADAVNEAEVQAPDIDAERARWMAAKESARYTIQNAVAAAKATNQSRAGSWDQMLPTQEEAEVRRLVKIIKEVASKVHGYQDETEIEQPRKPINVGEGLAIAELVCFNPGPRTLRN
jgi:hypothetical protein